MVRWSAFALVLVAGMTAACGGGPKPATGQAPPGNRGDAPPTLADGPPYAALFQDGQTLRFRRVHEESRYELGHPDANPDGSVVERTETELTCTVTARTVGAWQVAKVACPGADEDQLVSSRIAGVYLADARGLWRTAETALPTDETVAARLADGEPLLPAEPTLVDDRQEEEDGFGEAHKVAQAADGTWCVEHTHWGGDEGGHTYCFRAGVGLTKVSSYFAGGMSIDDSAERIP